MSALATIALLTGGYLAMSGATAEFAAAESSNGSGKGGMLTAAGGSSNEAGKGGMLTAAGASSNGAGKAGKLTAADSSNASGKGGMLTAAGASSNGSVKGGMLTAADGSGNEAGKSGKAVLAGASEGDTETIVKYNTIVTSTEVPNGVTKVAKVEDPFRPGPQYDDKYDAEGQVDIYGGKSAVEPPRPPIELGRQQYTAGDYGSSSTPLGELNPLLPGLAVYGDWRTAVAFNQNNGEDIAQIATRLNIDVDFKLTGTERIHAFFTPLQDNAKFTRFEFGGGAGDKEFTLEFDPNPQTLFFEGDLGAITAGFSGQESSFDLPFTVGLFPLFLQNGTWANDAILGGAFSIPAQNSPALGISNYDVTFFAAFDNVDNALAVGDSANRNNNVANLYGVTAFIDAYGGYIETGYGLLDGFDEQDGLLVNFLTAAYTRRYYNTLSNTTRVFANFGEGADADDEVDGFAIISENSLISGLPSTLLPYANFFIGFDNPQPLASAQGLLTNVGINFESDALTGFPFLDDTANDTYGGAIGLQYLFNLDQQIVVEAAMVQPHGDSQIDPQYALGMRYQIPLNRAWLFRADATYQFIDSDDGGEDNFGIRSELRRKF